MRDVTVIREPNHEDRTRSTPEARGGDSIHAGYFIWLLGGVTCNIPNLYNIPNFGIVEIYNTLVKSSLGGWRTHVKL